ncbi:MAG: PAS domain S-box protein, partial [Actinomycetota bacterium]
DKKLDYSKVAEEIAIISGAKYVGVDLYDENGSIFTTVGFYAPQAIAKKASSLLGFKLFNKKWAFDPVRAEKTKSHIITRFSTLREVTGEVIPRPLVLILEKTFNMGEVFFVKIMREDLMLGNFTLIMSKDEKLKNDEYIEIYSMQLGIFITRNRSEEKYRRIVESANEGIVLLDSAGRIKMVNKKMESLLGYTKEELLEHKMESFIFKEDHDDYLEKMKLRAQGKDENYERSFRCKDGRRIWTVVSATAIMDARGRFEGSFAMVTDNTEHKLNEIELFNLKRSIEQSISGMAGINMDGAVVFANNTWANMHGYTVSEITGRNFSIFHTQEQMERDVNTINELVKECGHASGEVGHLRKDGTIFLTRMQISLVRDENQKSVEMIASAIDITEQKKAELALIESEKKYHFLINNIQDIIYLIDIDTGVFLFVSDAWTKLLGHPISQVTGKPFQDFIHPDDIGKCYEFLQKVVITGEKQTGVEYRVRHSNGTWRWHTSAAIPIKNSEGAIINYQGEAYDITESKLQKESIKASEEKFRDLAEMMPEIIFETNTQGMVTFANKNAFDIFKYTQDDFNRGINILDVIAENYRGKVIKEMQKLLKKKKSSSVEYCALKKDGSIFPIIASSVPIIKNDKIIGIRGIMVDISYRKKREEKILHLSFYDQLTGLHNRRFFEEEIKRLDNESQLPLCIIMGDINGLKAVNDIFGRRKGDEILKEAARIFKKSCRIDDMLARLGGDEFVILLPKTSIAKSENIVRRIKKECKIIKNHIFPISISLGIAIKESPDQEIHTVFAEVENNMLKSKLLEKNSTLSSILSTLEKALSEKSNETKEHTDRMHELAIKLGEAIKLSQSQLDELSLLAYLHDIGKVVIPEKILRKKEHLTEKEWLVIKKHPEIGFNIAKASPHISHIAKPIMSCHERWDGKGYPSGLKGEEIPIISRIILIADAYDVMTSGRSYQGPVSKESALDEIKRCAGTQFDPELVNKFVKVLTA